MAASAHSTFRTSGIVQLTRPQLVGTLSGLMLGMLLAALDQTIVATAEPQTIAHLSGFDRYPWVSTAYLLSSTISVPIFAKLRGLDTKRTALWLSGGGAAQAALALGVRTVARGARDARTVPTISRPPLRGGPPAAGSRHGYTDTRTDARRHSRPRRPTACLEGRARRARPLRHLRDYSSFITPRTGLLSADTWTFVRHIHTQPFAELGRARCAAAGERAG